MSSRNVPILLVEDDRDDAELAIAALEGARLLNKIVHLKDGEETFRYLFEKPPDLLPCVVLLDLKMPKIDGFDVLRRIRSEERTKNLPVVVLTSSKEERDIARSYGLGANSYIVKPVDFDQFVSCVKELGLYWVVLNTAPTA
jgi:two-component system response regulator